MIGVVLQQDALGYRLPFRVRYPVELYAPPGFKADDVATWPRVDGRMEYVEGGFSTCRHVATYSKTSRWTSCSR